MNIDDITIHASATYMDQDIDIEDVRKWHTDPKPHGNGWSDVGYHFFIKLDGTIQKGRSTLVPGAHVAGHNTGNLGICLAGGLDPDGKPAFTFTEAQMLSLKTLVEGLLDYYGLPKERVCGHRDWSPDLNGDGIISPNEFMKDCPCFDVKEWVKATIE